MIIVHYVAKAAGEASAVPPVARQVLAAAEPVPPGAVWLDMVEPTAAEDRKVELYLGCKVPSRADPDFTEPPESYYAENGVRYLKGSVVSEPEGTPDVADVTFILTPATLVTVRYDPGDAFELLRAETLQVGCAGAQPRRGGGRPRQHHRQSFRPCAEQGRRGARLDRKHGLPGQGRPGPAEPDLFGDP